MLLERLCNASGPSGFEGDVRKIIIEEIESYVTDIKIDKIGNIIAHKKGNGPKVMIDAHMDEVGFIVTGFNEDGTLRFSALGGINNKIIPSKVVYIGKKNITGVIGVKPIHLQSGEERNKNLSYGDCCIDIGSNSKEESKALIDLGEYIVFSTKYEEFGEGLIKGKAFDNRMGCYVLIEALKEKFDCDLYATFNVMEEIGERGAFVAAYGVKPDIGIVLEGTICADMPNVPAHLSATEIGKGPAISIMDRTSIFNEDMAEDIINIANKENIMYQRRRAIAGGNDAAAIHGTGAGAKISTISVPCRYIHSSVSVASLKDVENTKALLIAYLKFLI
ncbi:M42 family metallopeptidase [Clostridium algidicarnis]|uniref:M42 family metallopeptidase n=1 Tax=Clostridium algidicarnis TaxID=37659 RepID=UPI001C0C97C1|nr:M42 family metallopeptidase [Clostridium algidicarnis]MBU3210599.1 M42 family metallopeptidase [Clostridium algidicarnis]MBU3228257.1 M42 family metallopeptidase [Clostridium algidicarnis]MBU3252141.1 M42 family metallopeptidase [Clostridium algidicarnis]